MKRLNNKQLGNIRRLGREYGAFITRDSSIQTITSADSYRGKRSRLMLYDDWLTPSWDQEYTVEWED